MSTLPKYMFNGNYDQLPIGKFKDTIINFIEENEIMIIEGYPGCGKTTKIPQMILDNFIENKRFCNIIVCVPRKLAAIALCHRVCSERNWDFRNGVFCGYEIALDKKHKCEMTQILFITAGLFVKRILFGTNHILKYTHIILDEVHERDIDTEFILLILKKLKKNKLLSLPKIILMSATIQKLLLDYFPQTAYFQIDVEVNHKINIYHLEEIKKNLGIPIALDTDEKDPEIYYQNEKIWAGGIVKIIEHLNKQELLENKMGCVLIFLPTYQMIEIAAKFLVQTNEIKNLIVLKLHSSVSLDKQALIFLKPEIGYRKVILSTNISETSITIPDVKYVIDLCLTKSKYSSMHSNYEEQYIIEWASKSNLTQRSGRAGRISDGEVYRLITTENFKNLQEYPEAPIHKNSLETIILNILNNENIFDEDIYFSFNLFIEPPNEAKIKRSIKKLQTLGGIKNIKNKLHLTDCGRLMACLPIEPRFSRLVYLGNIFGQLEQAVVLAAANLKPIFILNYGCRLEHYKAKFYWSNGYFCDFVSTINAYFTWRLKEDNCEFKNQSERQNWCVENSLSLYNLVKIHLHKIEIQSVLKQNFNLKYHENYKMVNVDLLKIIIAGAMYPNYFMVPPLPLPLPSNIEIERNSVWLVGINNALLYKNQLQKLFKICDGVIGSIEQQELRAKIKLVKDCVDVMPNTSIIFPIYMSICLRYIKEELFLNKINDDTNSLLIYNNIDADANTENLSFINGFKYGITIESIKSCGHFIARYDAIKIECKLANFNVPPTHEIEFLDIFKKIVKNSTTFSIDVFSCLNGTYRVNLFVQDVYLVEFNVKDLFLQFSQIKIYAEETDESAANHRQRQIAYFTHSRINNQEVYLEYLETNRDARKFIIKGPFSELESKVVRFNNQNERVFVDCSSINYVILDENCNSQQHRVLIAQENAKNIQKCTLKQTSLIPKVIGFVEIATMLFAPNLNFLQNKNTLIIGTSILSSNYELELEIFFDFTLDDEDIKYIINLRNHIKTNLKASETCLTRLFYKNRTFKPRELYYEKKITENELAEIYRR